MTTHVAGRRRHTARPHRYALGRAEWRSATEAPWSVVARRHDGLLRYARARGVVSLAVRYSRWGQRLIVSLPGHHDAAHFLDRADVALDVDACTAGRVRIIRVAGTALVVQAGPLAEEVADVMDLAADEAPDASTVIIAPESINWLPVVDDLRYPPLPAASDRLPATFME